MRSVPRISLDMNQAKRQKRTEAVQFVEVHDSKTSFFATRRDFLYTQFIEDPELVLKRQKELEEENLNKMKENTTSESLTSPDSTQIESPPIQKNEKKNKTKKENVKSKSRSIKQLTKSEMANVIDRLASSNNLPIENHQTIRQNNFNDNADTEKSPIRKKLNDVDLEAVFDRLYYESTELKMEKKAKLNEKVNDEYQIPESETDILTKSIALQKIKEMIESSFPDKQGITFNELRDIFISLGIIDNCEKIEKISQISYILNKWKIRNTDLYDSNIVKSALTQSIIGHKGKFYHFAKERMFSYLANRKNNEIDQQIYYSNQPGIQINHAKKLTQKTFDRLLSPRPDFSPPKNEEEEEINNVHIELSPRTQKILQKSEYANVKFEERDRKLAERAMSKIESIRNQMEKERQKMQRKTRTSIPKISPEERAKIEELKLKRQKDIENEKPSFKPDVMKYSEFLHLKEAMKEEKEKPPGFDAFLGRLKKGYELNQKKKIERERIKSLPSS